MLKWNITIFYYVCSWFEELYFYPPIDSVHFPIDIQFWRWFQSYDSRIKFDATAVALYCAAGVHTYTSILVKNFAEI